MKKMSKGKKIAIIIISVILSIAILLPIGAYAFVIFVVPRTMDGEEIKAQYIDNPAMSVSWQEYDKQGCEFSGNTNTYSKERFEITLPEIFVVNEEVTTDGMYSYFIKNGEELSGYIMISDPMYTVIDLNNPETKKELESTESMLLETKIMYGYASKKVYGIELGTLYDNSLVMNTIDVDDFNTENPDQVYLFSMYGLQKSMAGMGPLTQNRAIYKVDTDTYKGFIYDRSKVAETEDDKSYDMYSMDVYALDNLNYPYTIMLYVKDNTLTEDDIFAIFNSFKVK
jgi:hypothetical protein